MKIGAILMFSLYFIASLQVAQSSSLATCRSSCPVGCICPNNTCSSCEAGYTYQPSTQRCRSNRCVVPGCSLCSSEGLCIKCIDPYSIYNVWSRSCLPTCNLQNCARCKQGSNTCEVCSMGYSLYEQTSRCIQSPINNCLRIHDWRNKQFRCSLCLTGFKPSTDRTECIRDICPFIPDCVSCRTQSRCNLCRPGFSFINSICTPNRCQVTNCLYCDPNGRCLRCESGYSNGNNRCIQQNCMLPNCATCKPGSVYCDACASGYVYNIWNKQCELPSPAPHPQCQAGYQLSGGSCVKYACSVSGCALCSADGSCIQCTDPYAVYNQTLGICTMTCNLENCAKCKQESTSCELCASGYSLYAQTGSCIASPMPKCLELHDWRKQEFQCSLCETSFKPSTDQTLCISNACSSIANCQNCAGSSSICDSCRPGFSFVSPSCVPNTCTVANCLYCDPSGTCLRCSSGYSLASNQCTKITCTLPNCATCKPGSVFCDACASGYVYNVWNKQCEQLSIAPQPLNCERYSRIGSLFVCLSCLQGYTFAGDNRVSCIKQCPSNCANCSSSTNCSQCQAGYQLSGGSCVKYACSVSGCALCSADGSCIQCTDPYAVYSSSSGSCVASCSIANCQRCKAGSSECERCEDGFALYPWTNSCIFSSIPNCLQLADFRSFSYRCSRCLQGFRPSRDQRQCLSSECIAVENCLQCQNSQRCVRCRDGFRLQNKKCVINACNISACLACNEQRQCIRSTDSYQISSGRIVARACSIQNCQICKPNSIFCDYCEVGYEYNIWTKTCQESQNLARLRSMMHRNNIVQNSQLLRGGINRIQSLSQMATSNRYNPNIIN